MIRLMVTRLLATAVNLLLMSLLVFVIIRLIPGDPARAALGQFAEEEQIQAYRESLRLDDPIFVQYAAWLQQISRGELGTSIGQHRSVLPLLIGRFQNTLLLAIPALMLSTSIGIISGVFAAKYRNSIIDRLTTALALFGNSMPPFWLGLVLIVIFSVELGLLPSGGMHSLRGDQGFIDLMKHVALPAITLGVTLAGVIARTTRSAMLEVLNADYIRTARAKGLPERQVMLRHGLRNALVPIITVAGLQLGVLLGGVIVTETVFAWPGVGRLIFDAISRRDYPVLQGGLLLIAVTVSLANLAADIVSTAVSPRAKFG